MTPVLAAVLARHDLDQAERAVRCALNAASQAAGAGTLLAASAGLWPAVNRLQAAWPRWAQAQAQAPAIPLVRRRLEADPAYRQAFTLQALTWAGAELRPDHRLIVLQTVVGWIGLQPALGDTLASALRDAGRLSKLVEAKTVRETKPSRTFAARQATAAADNVALAEQLAHSQPAQAFSLAYDAGRQTCHALLALAGLRVTPGTKHQHVTTLDAAAALLGITGSARYGRLHAARQRRHGIQYEASGHRVSGHTSGAAFHVRELPQLLEDVRWLLAAVQRRLDRALDTQPSTKEGATGPVARPA